MSKLLTYFESIDREDIEWLWPGRIALGKVTLLSGDPGLGKGMITADIAARVSRGDNWPDSSDEAPQGGVIMFSAEDGLTDTVAPRLDMANADDRFVAVMSTELDVVEEEIGEDGAPVPRLKPFSLETDIPRLEQAIEEMNASGKTCRLVIIDPINEYTGRLDVHKNGELRSMMLRPLRILAQRFRVAVLIITHLNKNVFTPAQYRSGGSIALAAAARSTLMVAEDPENPGYRLLLGGKTNVGEMSEGLRYCIATASGAPGAVARVYWDGKPVTISTADAIAYNPTGNKELEAARDWVSEQLKVGDVPAQTLRDRKPPNVSIRNLNRALKEVAVYIPANREHPHLYRKKGAEQ